MLNVGEYYFDRWAMDIIKYIKTGITWIHAPTMDDLNKCYKSPSRVLEPDKPGYVLAIECDSPIFEYSGKQPTLLNIGICRGIRGEFWVAPAEGILKTKELDLNIPKDEQGFRAYRSKGGIIVEVLQIMEDFTVTMKNGTIATGKRGDYAIYGGNEIGYYICEYDIFHDTYKTIDEIHG